MSKRILFLFAPLLIISIEFFLRTYFGFCDSVLMMADEDIEYLAQPNQHRFRFRNHVIYNSQSMRSEEVDTSAIIVLGFGDSVLNGGVQTDHDSLATTLLSNRMSEKCGRRIQFLNISAGSWGPDNNYAYLNKYGDFNAEAIFLVVNSDDAHDNMTFGQIVDKHKSYPSKQYPLAVYELFDRYLLPRFQRLLRKTNPKKQSHRTKSDSKMPEFNSGFSAFHKYAKNNEMPLALFLHPNLAEVKNGDYNSFGYEIMRFSTNKGIPLIKGLDHGFEISDYRDGIHLNNQGQKKLSEMINMYYSPCIGF